MNLFSVPIVPLNCIHNAPPTLDDVDIDFDIQLLNMFEFKVREEVFEE